VAIISGGNWSLNDIKAQVQANVDMALQLRQRVALTAAKLARQSAQNIADTNVTYPEPGATPAAQDANRVADVQKLLDAHGEVAAAMAAYAPVASYDVASPSPIR
jgi:hypothetical protein